MLNYIVPTQPRRTHPVTFRTHITRPNSNFDIFHPDSILCQVILYRACHSREFISGAAIEDYHGYLFFDYPSITKKRMGDVVINSVLYNPRKLKGVTKTNPDRPRMIYVFREILDLQYGLEWQICSWLWKMNKPENEEIMDAHLRNIATYPLTQIMKTYVNPASHLFHKIDWPKVWIQLNLFDQEELLDSETKPERPELKSLQNFSS